MKKYVPPFLSLTLGTALFILLASEFSKQNCWIGTTCAFNSPYYMVMPIWTFLLAIIFSIYFSGLLGGKQFLKGAAIISLVLTLYLQIGSMRDWLNDYSNINLAEVNRILISLDYALIIGILFGSSIGTIISHMRAEKESAKLNSGTMCIGLLNIFILFIVAVISV